MLEPPPLDALSAPLAEYFFIAGIESSRVADHAGVVHNALSSPSEQHSIRAENTSSSGAAGLRPTSTSTIEGAQRRIRTSYNAKDDAGSRATYTTPISPTNKRNSMIIWEDGQSTVRRGGDNHSDEEFEAALHKFAAERESFLETIHSNAQGTAVPPPQQRPQRVSSPVASHRREKSLGSLRRRLSVLTRSSTNRRGMNAVFGSNWIS